MANLEVIALDAATPQLRAPGAGDAYAMPRPVVQAVGTLTTDVKVQDVSATWNNAGVTFTGYKINITDTASNAASLFVDLQVNGASVLKVNKTGNITVPFNASIQSSSGAPAIQFHANGTLYTKGILALNDGETLLRSETSNTFAQRNGVNAQTNRIYGTYTDDSNYRRLAQTMSADGVAEIKPEGAGTGVIGNVLHISGLPTSNPGAGILWNDAGTVKVGT